MRISRFPVFAVAVACLLTNGAATAHDKPERGDRERHKQNGQGDRGQNGSGSQNGDQKTDEEIIRQQKANLERVGPKFKAIRATAVTTLLSMGNEKAHVVLQEYVGPGEDSEGIRRLVLIELPRRLLNANEAGFYISKEKDVIRGNYFVKLVQHFDGKKPGDANLGELRKLARDALAAMNTKADLENGFKALFGLDDMGMKIHAVYAIGQARNVALAPLLGAHLDDKGKQAAIGVAARSALENLIYEIFPDQKSFGAWWQENRGRDYIELTERFARQSRQILRDRVGAAKKLHTQTMVVVVDLLATSKRIGRWKEIREHVFESGSTEILKASLGRLREVLADVIPDTKAASEARDRLDFLAEISRRLAAKPDATQHALLLEVGSYLCAPGETAARSAHEKLLQAGVDHPAGIVQRAALLGLRRFFSPANRAMVIKVASTAEASDDVNLVDVAVGTLMSQGWRAPKPTDTAAVVEWLEVLHRLLTTKNLGTELRGNVVKVLCLADVDGARLRPVFKILLAEVARDELALIVRQDVLLRLPQFFLGTSDASLRDALAGQYVQLLIGLQQTKARDIRLAAASRLVVPSNLTPKYTESLGRSVIESVGERLLEETDDAVFAAQVAALGKLAGKDAHNGAVNIRLRGALEALRSKAGTDERVKLLVAGLQELALTSSTPAAEWHKTCVGLLKLTPPARQSVRTILQVRVGRNEGKDLEQETPELQISIHKLVIRTAVLRPATPPWNTAKNDRDEAKMVRSAFELLVKAKKFTEDKFDTPAVRLTCLRCVAAVKDQAYLVQTAMAWLAPSDQALKGPDRDITRVLYAEALLALGKLDEAWAATELKTVEGPMLAERLRVTEAIANGMVKADKAASALNLLADLVARTPTNSADYWRRFELDLVVRYQVDPDKSPDLLKALDAWMSKQGSLTSEQKSLADALRLKLGANAKPGK